MKTSELTGPALDWAVCSSDGRRRDIRTFQSGYWDYNMYHYSTNWAQAGPIIEREGVTVGPHTTSPFVAHYGAAAIVNPNPWPDRYIGPTPLIAAMRCYVASKLGDEVDIPKELQ